MQGGQGTVLLVDEGIWQRSKGCDESGRREHALGNEWGDKGRALYWHTNGVGDIGILQQLYSTEVCRLEIPSSEIAYLLPSNGVQRRIQTASQTM